MRNPIGSVAPGMLLGLMVLAGQVSADGGWEVVWEVENVEAEDIAVNSRGDVYTLETDTDARVQVFTSDGKYLREWEVLDHAKSIAIDEKDVVYVLSPCWVIGYSSEGNALLGWDSCIGQGDLQRGMAVDVQGGLVYVGTVNNLLKFAMDGTLLDVFDYGWEGIDVVADGSIWAVTYALGEGLVRHYSSSGEVLAEWYARLPGEEASDPSGIAVDSGGRLFISDIGSGLRIKIFRPDGALDDLIQGPLFYPSSIELDGDYVLYVGTGFPDNLRKLVYKVVSVEPATWGRIKVQYGSCFMPSR